MLKFIISVALMGIGLFYLRKYFAGCVYKTDLRLDGKTVVITGANSGIGLETVKILLQKGATVIATSRDSDKCRFIVEHVQEIEGNEQVSRLKCVILDLASRKSIESCAEEILSVTDKIHILINNAAVLGLNEYYPTEEGFEMHFGVNHLGHFLLTHLLTPRLIESKPSRIVMVSALAHAFSYGLKNMSALNDPSMVHPWYSYAESKAANILHAQELSRRLKSKGVTAVSLHPGVIGTNITRHSSKIIQFVFHYGHFLFLKTPWEGSQTTVFCAIDPSVEEQSGTFFSDCAPAALYGYNENDERGPVLWKFSEDFWKIKTI